MRKAESRAASVALRTLASRPNEAGGKLCTREDDRATRQGDECFGKRQVTENEARRVRERRGESVESGLCHTLRALGRAQLSEGAWSWRVPHSCDAKLLFPRAWSFLMAVWSATSAARSRRVGSALEICSALSTRASGRAAVSHEIRRAASELPKCVCVFGNGRGPGVQLRFRKPQAHLDGGNARRAESRPEVGQRAAYESVGTCASLVCLLTKGLRDRARARGLRQLSLESRQTSLSVGSESVGAISIFASTRAAVT